jgi:hypothetical protein
MSSEVASESIFPCEAAKSAAGLSSTSFMGAEEHGDARGFRMLGCKMTLKLSIERERLRACANRAFDGLVMASSVLAVFSVSNMPKILARLLSTYLYRCRC